MNSKNMKATVRLNQLNYLIMRLNMDTRAIILGLTENEIDNQDIKALINDFQPFVASETDYSSCLKQAEEANESLKENEIRYMTAAPVFYQFVSPHVPENENKTSSKKTKNNHTGPLFFGKSQREKNSDQLEPIIKKNKKNAKRNKKSDCSIM